MIVMMLIVLLCSVILHLSLIHAKFTRPENFYGSEALLDGYCDEAQYFTDVFTLPSERLKVEGTVRDVEHKLAACTTRETGQPYLYHIRI